LFETTIGSVTFGESKQSIRGHLMSTRWVTFDCFGTLVDWHTGFSAILRDVAGDRLAELISAYHRHERAVELERPHRLYQDVLAIAARRASDEIALPMTDQQANALPRHWGSQPVFVDVEPALTGLRSAGYRLAVLTNCDDDLFAETQKSFRQPFDLVITAEQVKDYKPSPSHFRRFFRVSGVEMADWVHVACSWFHDIEPARELGIKRIWVDRDRMGEDPSGASARLPDATGLVEAVARMHP
jgi:2-haloacid dehalogenase